MTAEPPISVAIAGGGLGGLTVAIALRRAGVDFRVFEQSAALTEIGAGIQLAPNAVRVLRRLGVEPPGVALEVPFEFRRWEDGRVLFSQAYGAAGEARFGAPYLTVHRAELLALLAASVPSSRVSLGRRVVGVSSDGTVVFADGSSETFDVVVGADGIHSVARGLLAAGETPVFTGLAAWRALVPASSAPAFARRPVCSIWLGPGRHFVHYPVSGGRFVNLVTAGAAGDWREESWTAPGSVSDFLAEFSGWADPVLELIAAATDTRRYAYYSRPPLEHWVRGRVALMGDAAHPMLPFFAQGAGQAIEDAAVLAACIARGELERYEALRIERATRVQRMSAERREHHHMPDGPAQRARDEALGSVDPIEHNAWLYSYDVPT